MITKISIENIKGFGSPPKDIDVQLYPGKPNIVVAPNGYGKSSLSKAFDCLTPKGIVLGETDYHENDISALPSLKVEHDGILYVTDSSRNEVFDHFQCVCINSPLKATSVTQRIRGSFNHTKSSLNIEEVVFLNNVPVDKSLVYSSSGYKAQFGVNGKIIPNINSDLGHITSFPFDEMESFGGTRKWAKVQSVIDYLNTLSGTVEAINASVDESQFTELESLVEYQKITMCISHFMHCETKLDIFLRFWILKKLYFANKKLFKQSIERNRFNRVVDNLNKSISSIDTTWVGVSAVEDGRRLLIRFPKAGSISYGQRDSLFLFATLERIKLEIDYTKPVILIVDELFDYLDSVNMTIIQYFFSEFIRYCRNNVEIYPIILTHLSPDYYHNYTFTKMKVNYLGFSEGITNTPTKSLLRARGNDELSSPIYGDVSKYLLHYHTGTINRESDFLELGLRKKWGTGYGFVEYLVEECNKYIADQPYDYYAIATAVRIRVEKIVYDQLQTDDGKTAFVAANGTKKKFEMAESCGVEVPDVFGLLGIIYNDTEHLPQNNDADKAIIYRLNNPIIKHMIHTLFNCVDPITLDYLV